MRREPADEAGSVPPVELEDEVLLPGRWPALERPLDQGPDDVPDLGPALLRRDAQSVSWMLVARDRYVGIVVEHGQLRAPVYDNGKTRREAKLDGMLQRFRPLLWWAKRRRRPVQAAHPACHLALAWKEGMQTRFHLASASEAVGSRGCANGCRLTRHDILPHG